jgi:hypothetical protein
MEIKVPTFPPRSGSYNIQSLRYVIQWIYGLRPFHCQNQFSTHKKHTLQPQCITTIRSGPYIDLDH